MAPCRPMRTQFMNFEFATATRIVFGSGTLSQAGAIAGSLGRSALVVTGRNPARCSPVLPVLRNAGVATAIFSVAGEPTLRAIEEGVQMAKRSRCDLVVGIGGGSAIDAGKAIAAMLTNEGELLDYVEVIGRGRLLSRPGAPFIAIPTTAGTGAEVTRNAVLGSPEHRVKVSLRSPLMLPRVALVDPALTLGLPPATTASTGLDALTQLVEAYVSLRANPMTDALCVQGIPLAAQSLERACRHPDDLAAREAMSLAAMFSGIALANAGLGAVHGFAAPIGGMCNAPHGAVCAALLPHVWRVNLDVVSQRGTADQVRRFDELGRLLTQSSIADGADASRWLGDLCARLQVRSLEQLGVARSDVPEIINRAAQASSMKANPVPLERHELETILSQAL